MELAISKLTARRVIYYFEGYVKGERPKGLKFVFYNYDLKITIIPSVFEWDGDTFRMMLHVEQANENNPIPVVIIIRLLWMEKESSIHCRWQKALLKNGNRRSGKMMWSLTKEKDIM